MKYTPVPDGMAGYLAGDPDLRAELRRRADMGLQVAAALAPRLRRPRRDRVVGALAASGHVVDDGVQPVYKGVPRMQYSVVFDVDYAAAATYDRRRSRNVTTAYLLAAKTVMERG